MAFHLHLEGALRTWKASTADSRSQLHLRLLSLDVLLAQLILLFLGTSTNFRKYLNVSILSKARSVTAAGGSTMQKHHNDITEFWLWLLPAYSATSLSYKGHPTVQPLAAVHASIAHMLHRPPMGGKEQDLNRHALLKTAASTKIGLSTCRRSIDNGHHPNRKDSLVTRRKRPNDFRPGRQTNPSRTSVNTPRLRSLVRFWSADRFRFESQLPGPGEVNSSSPFHCPLCPGCVQLTKRKKPPLAFIAKLYRH